MGRSLSRLREHRAELSPGGGGGKARICTLSTRRGATGPGTTPSATAAQGGSAALLREQGASPAFASPVLWVLATVLATVGHRWPQCVNEEAQPCSRKTVFTKTRAVCCLLTPGLGELGALTVMVVRVRGCTLSFVLALTGIYRAGALGSGWRGQRGSVCHSWPYWGHYEMKQDAPVVLSREKKASCLLPHASLGIGSGSGRPGAEGRFRHPCSKMTTVKTAIAAHSAEHGPRKSAGRVPGRLA